MAGINCSLIELARQSRGLSQKEAAERIGISQGKLSKAENQLQSLPSDVMRTLAKVYDYPIEFFERSVTDSERHGFFFRKRVSIPQRNVDEVVAKADILRIIMDDFLESIELPDFPVPEYDLQEITPQQIAIDVRRLFNLNYGPISNMHLLLENNGIIIIEYDFGTSKIDALSGFTRLSHPIIIVNANRPTDRKRFTLAHELGHLVMHARYGFTVETKEMEEQADAFASEFLMPEREIKGVLYNLSIPTVAEIKRRWKVSMQSIIRKAHQLNCITESRYKNLQIEFSRRGWRVNEPILLPDESPCLVKNIIKLYKEELDYTDEELMRILTINSCDYHKVIIHKQRNKVIEFSRLLS